MLPHRRHRRAAASAAVPGLALLVVLLLAGVAAARTPPDPPRGDARIVVFGDVNGPYGSVTYGRSVRSTVAAIAEVWRPDLLLSPGDVVAGQQASLPDERLSAMWAAFDRDVAAPLRAAGVPYAVAMGNHDASSLRDADGDFLFARDRRAAAAYWGRPMYDANLAYVDRARHPFDYAFTAGEAFVVVLDASSPRVSDEQRTWLARTLARREAAAARLRIVVGHLPLVPVGRGREGPGEVVARADALHRLLVDGGVDLYVSGHHAAYYPGRLGDLELLFAGGVGARALLAGEAPPRSTVTVIDVWHEPLELRYTTFDVATMEVVPASTLPPVIGTGAAAVRLSERATGGVTADAGGPAETP